MGALEEFLSTVQTVAQTAEKKTCDFVETTKLKMAISNTQKELASTFEGMGRLLYDAHASGEDITPMLEEGFLRVEDLSGKLQKLQDRLMEYKKAIRCPHCGEINPEDSVYCRKCGAKCAD